MTVLHVQEEAHSSLVLYFVIILYLLTVLYTPSGRYDVSMCGLQMRNWNWADFGLLFACGWRHDFRKKLATLPNDCGQWLEAHLSATVLVRYGIRALVTCAADRNVTEGSCWHGRLRWHNGRMQAADSRKCPPTSTPVECSQFLGRGQRSSAINYRARSPCLDQRVHGRSTTAMDRIKLTQKRFGRSHAYSE